MLQLKRRNNFFIDYFPSALVKWSKFYSDIYNSPSYSAFKKKILNLMRPRSNIVFNIIHTKRLIFLTHFHVSVSHVSENRFKHSSLDALNLICICGFDIETLNLVFFHCPRFNNQRQNLLLKIEGVIPNIFIKTATGIKQKPFMEI